MVFHVESVILQLFYMCFNLFNYKIYNSNLKKIQGGALKHFCYQDLAPVLFLDVELVGSMAIF